MDVNKNSLINKLLISTNEEIMKDLKENKFEIKKTTMRELTSEEVNEVAGGTVAVPNSLEPTCPNAPIYTTDPNIATTN